MLIVVFIVAVLKQNVFLVLFLLFIEVLAAIWYSISYIPFGRKIALQFLRQIGICMPCFFVYDSVQDARKDKSKTTTSSVSNSITGVFKGNQK
jgi:hypothetical protein